MKKRILVIEDEKGIRDNLRILLETENFEVVLACDGNQGLVQAYKCKPDMIICDIMLPDRDGYSILETLNKDKKFNLIPFIFLTAKVEKSDLRKGMNLGADDYLFKPFDADDLLKAVNARLLKSEKINTNVEENKNSLNNESIIVRAGDSSHSVLFSKILYIIAERQYSFLFTDNDKKYVTKKSLNQWEEILPAGIFIRIHRGTIINSTFINKVEKTSENRYTVFLNQTDTTMQVSRRMYKNLKHHII